MSDHDSNFFKTFTGVLAVLVAIAFIIFFVAQYVIEQSGLGNDTGSQAIRDEAIAKRIAPEGKVRMMGDAEIASSSAAGGSEGPKSAKDIVTATCSGCHGSGVLGAPKIGDKASWEGRYAAGLDAMVATAIAGKGAMPPRGGNASLSDEQVRAAVEQMLADSGYDVSVTDLTAGAETAAPAESASATDAVANAAGDAAQAVADTASNVAGAAMDAVSDAAAGAAAMVSDVMAPVAGTADNANGEKIYNIACIACHSVGVAGAPRLGDNAAWAARIAQGADTLNTHALKGFRGMPPKGGRMDLSDADVTAAVAYMVAKSQ